MAAKKNLPMPAALDQHHARIREAREDAGLGVVELEDDCQLSRGRISRAENPNPKKRILLGCDELIRVANRCGVRVGWLLANEQPKSKTVVLVEGGVAVREAVRAVLRELGEGTVVAQAPNNSESEGPRPKRDRKKR